ncbi:MAG: hypothetical protein H8E34_03695 [Bacteroidetes bacterium]|nr:hypothetical protein [Bacteroidota bacterium]MBL6944624.1 hypothetical protein [Bacteroidales bacterium]
MKIYTYCKYIGAILGFKISLSFLSLPLIGISSFYSDIFSISERIGDFIINVSEAIEEYQKTE